MNKAPSANAVARTPTHRCKVCGCKWIYWQAGTPNGGTDGAWWSLGTNETPAKCCDNVAMGDQIELMPPCVWLVIGVHGEVEFGSIWSELCHEHISEAIADGDDEEAGQWIVREYAPV